MKRIKTASIIAVATLAITSEATLTAQGLSNGGFSPGLNAWTTYLPPNNNLTPDQEIASFDIDGPGPLGSSPAFHVGVGAGALLDLQQSVLLTAGVTYNFAADLAMTPPGNNGDGGTVSVFIGSTLITFHSFGAAIFDVNQYANVAGTFQPTQSGPYTLSVNFSRSFGFSPGWQATPSDWIDNIQLSPVPEPTAGALSTLGCGLMAFSLRKRGQFEARV